MYATLWSCSVVLKTGVICQGF